MKKNKIIELFALIFLVICFITPMLIGVPDPAATDAGVMTIAFAVFNLPFFLVAMACFVAGLGETKQANYSRSNKRHVISILVSISAIIFINIWYINAS